MKDGFWRWLLLAILAGLCWELGARLLRKAWPEKPCGC